MRFRRATPSDPAKPPRSTRARMLIAALAGAAGVLAFAPFGYWPLQIVSLAILFYQMLRANGVKSGFLIGWAYGFGWCAAGIHWLFIALHRFGGLPSVLAALAIALLALFMGLYVALAMGAAAWLRKRWILSLPLTTLLVLPSMWSLFEWVRGWLFTGFPWVSAGYAHNTSPLAGFAPVLGVYGLGWLAALSAGALLLLMHRRRYHALAGLFALFAAAYGLQFIAWTHPVGRPISVRLLQGNIPQDEKFSVERATATLDMYRDMIRAEPADLIATPETAVAWFPKDLPPDYLSSLAEYAHSSNSYLLVGIPLMESPTVYSNSALGFWPMAGAKPYRYDKHHLVPFGEFIPAGFRWFVDLMSIPLGDFRRGPAVQPPFKVRDQLVLPNICYEDLFGEEIADQLASAHNTGQQSASVLLNISNLAWYGASVAIPQHLQISQMRSLETGRPMLRSTNTGATAVIDQNGKVVSRLAQDTRGTLAATVQGMGGMTPYILYGNNGILVLIVLALTGAFLLAREARKQTAAAPESSR